MRPADCCQHGTVHPPSPSRWTVLAAAIAPRSDPDRQRVRDGSVMTGNASIYQVSPGENHNLQESQPQIHREHSGSGWLF